MMTKWKEIVEIRSSRIARFCIQKRANCASLQMFLFRDMWVSFIHTHGVYFFLLIYVSMSMSMSEMNYKRAAKQRAITMRTLSYGNI